MRVTESMAPAWETMKRLLFRPFRLGTWFSFGLVFFLQSCVDGDGNGAFNLPDRDWFGDRSETASDLSNVAKTPRLLHEMFDPHAGSLDTGLLVVIAIVVCVTVILLVLLTLWLGTRGQMMAIRGIAVGRSDVGLLWNETRAAGNALFKFHLALSGLALLALVPALVVGAMFALSLRGQRSPSFSSFVPVLVTVIVVALLVVLPLLLVQAMLRNFVAPIMLKDGVSAREGWRRFWAVGRGHVGSIVVFFVLRILLGVGAGIVGVIASFLTCCLGFLPIVHQTLMAPYYVFERAWTLEVLASMSPHFDLRGIGPESPPQRPDQGGSSPYNPYAGAPTDNPYAPPGYGTGGGSGGPPGGFDGP